MVRLKDVLEKHGWTIIKKFQFLMVRLKDYYKENEDTILV